jgi:hypothetical protein
MGGRVVIAGRYVLARSQHGYSRYKHVRAHLIGTNREVGGPVNASEARCMFGDIDVFICTPS